MIKLIRYSIYDLIRSRWSYVYFFFYLILGFVFLFLNNNIFKAVITLMNVIIILTPLIGTVFGIMYYYNLKEFTELLLSQPIKRTTIILAQYLGLCLSLSMSLVLGLGIPFLLYGIMESSEIWNFASLLLVGFFLTFIFVAFAFNIAMLNDNKIKGFGFAILLWLFFAVIYDGIFLISLMVFHEYPLAEYSLLSSILNPIDLSRILILLKLDISVLLGYTGAVFHQFFGSIIGMSVSFASLVLWILLPCCKMLYMVKRKDF